VEPRPQDYVTALPDKLRTDLADAWVAGLRNVTEGCAADVPARVSELRMVEYVEELSSKLQGHCFRNGHNLRYSEISVVEAGAVEEAAIRGPETSAIRPDQSPRH
jgi:hypothetical protein